MRLVLYFVCLLLIGCTDNSIEPVQDQNLETMIGMHSPIIWPIFTMEGTWKAVQDDPYVKMTVWFDVPPSSDTIKATASYTFPWGTGNPPHTITVSFSVVVCYDRNSVILNFYQHNTTYSRLDFVGRFTGEFYSSRLIYGIMGFQDSIFPISNNIIFIRII